MENTTKWGIKEVHGVAVLDDSNFEEFIKKHKHVFVDFYADWCGPCKMMAPAYAEVAKKMNSDENGIPVVKIDASKNPLTGKKHEIRSYPTLKFFENGKSVQYQGGRSTSEIYNFIRKKTGFSSEEIKEEGQVKTLMESKVAAFYFLDKEDSDALDSFKKVGGQLMGVVFGHTFDQDLVKDLGVSKKYGLVVLRKFDDGNVVLESDEKLSEEEIKKFICSYENELVEKIDTAGNRIFNDQNNALILVTDKNEKEVVETFTNLAKEHRSDGVVFSKSTISTGLGVRLAQMFGYTTKDDPCVYFVNFKNQKMLKSKISDLSKENLEKSFQDFQNGSLKPDFKSEEIPEKKDLPLKVVGKTFEEEVLKSNKWVFLDIYAHWCGPCKAMAPAWKELAEKLKDDQEIVVGKIDGSLNEHEKLDVKSYPTIRLYKPDSEEFVAYKDGRNLDGFLKFLEANLGRKLL